MLVGLLETLDQYQVPPAPAVEVVVPVDLRSAKGSKEGAVVVTFPNLREGVLSVNSQIVSLRTFLSKRFPGNNSFCKVNSPVNLNRVWFGPF